MSHTPMPWRIGKAGGVVSDSKEGLEAIPGAHDKDAFNYYGGYLIAESVTRENAEFIVEACNAYERLKKERGNLREAMDFMMAIRACHHPVCRYVITDAEPCDCAQMSKAREAIALCDGGAE